MSWKVKDRDACFICMKLLDDQRSPVSRPSHHRQRHQHPPGEEGDGGPSQASSSSCGDSDNDSSKLLKRLLLIFSGGNPRPEPSYWWKVYEDIKGHQVFCDKCEVTVTRLCDLYKTLRELEMKLNWKLGEVGGLMESSGKSVEGEALFFAFSKPAGWKHHSKEDKWYSRKEVIKMRKGLATKCVSRADTWKCKVVIHAEEGKAATQLLPSPVKKPVKPVTPVGKSHKEVNYNGEVYASSLSSSLNNQPRPTVRRVDVDEIVEDLLNLGGEDNEPIDNEPGEPEMDGDDNDWVPPERMEEDDDNLNDLYEEDEDWEPPAPKNNAPVKKKNSVANVLAWDEDEGNTSKMLKPVTEEENEDDIEKPAEADLADPEFIKKLMEDTALKLETNNLTCDICQLTFSQKYIFKRHMNQKHEGIPNHKWKCAYCPLQFATSNVRRRHVNKAHPYGKKITKAYHAPKNEQEEKWLKTPCPLCGGRFRSRVKHFNHLMTYHERFESNDKRVGRKCFFCSKAYAIDCVREFHIANQRHIHVKTEFPCDHIDCPQIFDTVTKLTDHFNSDHAGLEVVKCSGCGWPFLNIPMLELHELVHLPNSRRQNFCCPKCEHKAVSLNSLEDHYNAAHLGDLFLYKCHDCGVLSRSKTSSFLHHRRYHNRMPSHVVACFKCEHCGALYREKPKLKMHIRNLHSGKPFTCKVCKEEFASKNELGRHAKSEHEPTRTSDSNYICSECGKSWSTSTQMKNHMRTHNPDKFECHICHKMYRQQKVLLRHIKNEHEIGKEARKPEYVCAECGKGYFGPGELRDHMKQTHLPEDESNPLYKCSRCHKKWARKCDYSDHLGTSCWKNADPAELAAAMSNTNGIKVIRKIRIRDRRKGQVPIKSTSD